MSILDINVVVSSSINPNAANILCEKKTKKLNVVLKIIPNICCIYPATRMSVTKSKVKVASSLTRWTILATLYRALADFTNLSQAVCFRSAIDLEWKEWSSISVTIEKYNQNIATYSVRGSSSSAFDDWLL